MNRTSFVALLSSGLFAGGGAMVGLSFGVVFLGLGDLVPAMSAGQLVALFSLYWTAIALTIIPVALVKTVALAVVAFRRQTIPGVRRLWRWAFGLWTSIVEAAIREKLYGGPTHVEAVCRRLRISRSTLQRRLREKGYTFQDIFDQIRFDLAALKE